MSKCSQFNVSRITTSEIRAMFFLAYTKEVIISKNYILHCEKKRTKPEKEMAKNRERDEEEGVDELLSTIYRGLRTTGD